MYVAKCLCGPRRTSLRFIAKDARKALNNDPTGTRALQRRWSTALDQRWRSIDKMLPQAIARYLDPVDMLSHAASFGSNPVQAFQGWLDEAMRQVIVGTNGAWLLPYVRSATDAGFVHAKRTEPKPVADAFSPDQPRDPHGMWTNSGDRLSMSQFLSKEELEAAKAKWNSGTASTAKSMPPHVLNGVAFTSYHHEGDWANVKGQANIQEPPLPALRPAQEYTSKDGTSYTVPGDRLSSGVIMHEPDGRVWLTKPTNGFGGYKHSWPKGGVEDGLHPQANAIKEAYEETGLKARITGFAGDFKGDTGVTRMYHAVRVGGHPADKGWESEAVVLARKEDLGKLLNRSRDQKIANTIHGVNIQPKTYKKDAAPPADRTNLLQTFAITELQGIVEAVSQQLVRAFAAGLLAKQSAQQITRAARQVISTVGIRRGRMLASFMCVRAFNAAALDGYRAQGLTHVGIDPERAPAKIIGDAKGSGKGGRTKKAEKKLQQALGEGDVDVLTAEDNDVCDECQGIAESGPYSLDEAEDLIPAHPNCRCAFIPADESAHESDDLEDAYDPNEAREQNGQWTAGEAAGSAVSGSTSQGLSEPYQSRSSGNDKGNGRLADIPVQHVYTPSLEQQVSLAKQGATPLTFSEISSKEGASRFHDLIAEAKQNNKYGAAVALYSKEDYEHARLFSTSDGKVGFALKGDDIVSVFKNPSSDAHDIVASILPLAVQQGGRRLDCFDTVLPHMYAAQGFKAVSRTPFDEHYQPEGWSKETFQIFNGGKPDVVFMAYDKHAPAYKKGDGASYPSYDEAMHAQQMAVKPQHAHDHLLSRYGIRSAFDEQSWNEQDHPRDDHGMFTFAGSGLDKMGTDIGHVASMYKPGEHGHPELMTHYGIEVGSGKDQLAVLASAATHNVDLKELDSGVARGGVKLYKVTNANGGPVTAPAPTAAHPAEQFKKQVKGTAPERVAMRKQLKGELNPEVSKQLKGKIIASFWKQHDKLPQGDKKQEIADKLAKFTKEYKMANPLTAAPAPKAAAEKPIDLNNPSHVFESMLKQEGVKYGSQEDKQGTLFNVMNKHDLVETASKYHPDAQKLSKFEYYVANTKGGLTAQPTSAPKSAETTAATSGNSAALKMSDLTKVGEKMGSNKGGTYQDKLGQKYYVKEPKTEDHVKNELLAAKLYELAGAKTLHYVPIEGGGHVATKLENLDKSNVSQLSPAERTQAQKDFGVHAWTGNWDAAGTGGDNQGTLHGNTVTLDVGGSLKYRAQGEPKEFGDKVTETKTLRDPAMNHDANKLYGDMSKEQLHEAYGKVTAIKNSDIVATVQSVYGPGGHANDMAHTLINRKDDLAKQAEALGVKPPPIAITATPAELEKAKKNLPLQMQYVPGASALAGHPEAEKLLKAFNDKYEGKTLTTPEELQKKVNDFNQLKADMVPHMNAQQQAQAAQAVKAQKAKKLAEANSIKAQVKASIAAKAAAPVDFETEALKGVGVSPNGGKYYDQELKSLGITMSGPQKAAISAYVGSSYAHLNGVLRTGKNMNVDQIKFAKVLDTALAKMPVHAGYAQRGIKSDPGYQIFQHYADNVGKAVVENAFSSAGVSHKLWGETTLHIESKTAADISKLNSEGGGEVIFRPGTYLHIKKANAKTHEIWAEEIG